MKTARGGTGVLKNDEAPLKPEYIPPPLLNHWGAPGALQAGFLRPPLAIKNYNIKSYNYYISFSKKEKPKLSLLLFMVCPQTYIIDVGAC